VRQFSLGAADSRQEFSDLSLERIARTLYQPREDQLWQLLACLGYCFGDSLLVPLLVLLVLALEFAFMLTLVLA
jgi:hypothetical protein